MIRRTALIASVYLMTACASSPSTEGPSTNTQSGQAATSSSTAELPPQTLAQGECGLFLWGMSSPRKFVFFTKATSENALMLHEDAPEELVLMETDGEVFGQFFTLLHYVSPQDGWTVRVELTPGEDLEGGQRVQAGRLVTQSVDGWETILPVNGIRACIAG